MTRFNKLVFCLWLCVPLAILILICPFSRIYTWWRANYEWVWENKTVHQKIHIFKPNEISISSEEQIGFSDLAKQKPQQQLTYQQIRQIPTSYQSDEYRLSDVENRLDNLEWENQRLQSQLDDLFQKYRNLQQERQPLIYPYERGRADTKKQYDREQPEQFKKTYSDVELFRNGKYKTIYEGQQENGGRWVRGNRNILGAPAWQWISEEEYQDRLRQQEQLIRDVQHQETLNELQSIRNKLR